MGTGIVRASGTLAEVSALPSVLENAEGLLKELEKRQAVFFLDFDGTLAPIVPNPDAARMPPATKEVLTELVDQFPTAIVTGRGLSKVKSFIDVDGLIYAGSHGFDIEAPGLGAITVGKEHIPTLKKIRELLSDAIAAAPGSALEDNRLSVSVHYRHVKDEEQVRKLRHDVASACKKLDLLMRDGKKVWEIRPQFDWHKGKAVELLIRRLGFADESKYLPIYIGDDVTDEDAFGELGPFGGIGVIVWDEDKHVKNERPRMTKACIKVRNPYEVCDLLKKFVDNEKIMKIKKCDQQNGILETMGTDVSY